MEKDDDTKSHVAIQCAKAAMLLHSLGHRRDQQEKETRRKTIEELKMELVKERYMRRNLVACNLLQLLMFVVLMFSISTLLLLIMLKIV
ncbi:hypothetical protein vseg_009149 [Gypsophila vaccaria]